MKKCFLGVELGVIIFYFQEVSSCILFELYGSRNEKVVDWECNFLSCLGKKDVFAVVKEKIPEG